jgi:hypothetical protein
MAHSNTYNPEGIDDLDLADPYDPSVEDESWDDMGGDTNAPLPKKKKGKLFTVVVIALGVVAFLGILYVQGGKTGAGSVADTAQIPAPVMVVQEEVGPSIAAGDLPALDVAVPDLTASVPLTPMPGLDEPPMPDAVMVAPDPIVTDLSVANTAEIEATIEPPPRLR